jgi:hypothetical protein
MSAPEQIPRSIDRPLKNNWKNHLITERPKDLAEAIQ